jgi:hypothetical protein
MGKLREVTWRDSTTQSGDSPPMSTDAISTEYPPTADGVQQQIVVAYAKVVEDKIDGICIQGVFFGGIASTREEADSIARDCVNNVKGGTILPRLFPTEGKADVLLAMDIAATRFGHLEVQMFQAEEIYQRTQEAQARARASK